MKLSEQDIEEINKICDKFEEEEPSFNKQSFIDFLNGYWKTEEELKIERLRIERVIKLNRIFGSIKK